MPDESWGEIAIFFGMLTAICVAEVALVLWLWPT
jgi:hypothetical protein